MTFNYNGKDIYYEDYGGGFPLLILNGIFMSASSWRAFIPAFSRDNRLLLLDMLDQGKSAKSESEYTQDAQCAVVAAFLDHMGLASVNIAGISYGGEVAQKFAATNKDRVNKLVLSNTTAYTSPWLRDIGHSWEYAFESLDGRQFFKTCIPIVYSPKFYEENHEWMKAREALFSDAFDESTYKAFGRLTRSAENFDERERLPSITAPTLLISSELDFVTPPACQLQMAQLLKNASHITISDAGHALMYEKPAEFAAAVIGFVNNDLKFNIL